jgi:hypothetical protein
VTQLTAMSKKTKDDEELGAIEQALNNANDIIEAGSKLPPPAATDKKSKP